MRFKFTYRKLNPTYTLYPYQIKSLEDLPEEEWRPLKGFEDYYAISNLGRIKSLDRYVKHKSGKPLLVPSKVLSQTVYKYFNKFTKDHTYALRAALSKENKRYDVQVRRIVYQAFVGELDPKQCVINIDNDGFNNRVENLTMVPMSVKQKRVTDNNRTLSYLSYADRSTFKKIGGNRRKVGRYNRKGDLVKAYESIAEAARRSGFQYDHILDVAKGRKPHYKGVVWKYIQK
ncbi:NUMOD4 domain-containing protein [Fulvivirga kasyanovii]|uniref:NUMOD4 domain-containing protein n=1 Tax=Fulvivirga kasyanovii TaxID=396812 RepID=A0ABW9RUL0_9BACT|nr:NUMOD4 domain-containing protein [Fulvivirga kasyanovii]MTI27576.1 hypothetical protein [Fulvivirga kasyanovii]